MASNGPASARATRWAAALAAIAAALTIGAGAAPAAQAGATAASPPPPAVPAVAAPAFTGRLYGVTAISPSDVWAVGLTDGGTLALHWNGRVWSKSPIATVNGYFNATASTSAGNVWAVGGTNWFAPSQPLADRWNGRSWSRTASQDPSGGGDFDAVAATTAGNAWAVGSVGPGPGISAATTPLIEHWNGRRWTEQNITPVPDGGLLAGVAATSGSNAWAVGQTGSPDPQTLIEHWTGRAWARVPSPNVPGATSSALKSVTVISAGNAWAIGSAIVGGDSKALTMHWDGRRWTIVPGNTPGGDVSLLGVLATWTHNIWAVGITRPSTCEHGGPPCQTLIEHWNSKRWKVLPSPNPPSRYLNLLWSASATSRSDIWAVGTTDYASTLIVHWNGAAWS